jgi:hypothetical protein
VSSLGAQIGRILVNRNHPEWLERLGQFERNPIHAAKVRNASSVGSQNASIDFITFASARMVTPPWIRKPSSRAEHDKALAWPFRTSATFLVLCYNVHTDGGVL